MGRLRSSIWETVAIFIAILAMWPMILRWESPVFKVILYLALLAMIAVFVRRWKRFHRLVEEKRESTRGEKQGPGGK